MIFIFTSDFCFLGLDEHAHDGENVLPPLRSSVGNIQVMQRHILYDFLLLVYVSFGQRNVFFSLKQEIITYVPKCNIDRNRIFEFILYINI